MPVGFLRRVAAACLSLAALAALAQPAVTPPPIATRWLGEANMRAPGAFATRSDTSASCARSSFFWRSAVNTTYAVIIFVSEAGSKRSSSDAPARACPLVRSRRK